MTKIRTKFYIFIFIFIFFTFNYFFPYFGGDRFWGGPWPTPVPPSLRHCQQIPLSFRTSGYKTSRENNTLSDWVRNGEICNYLTYIF
jgi:hypothetical protein